jgi:hypothetical protein
MYKTIFNYESNGVDLALSVHMIYLHNCYKHIIL